MAAQALEEVLNHPAIWRGSECARVAAPSIPTGFAELDAVLPGGGWPAGALTEIHCERPGAGELQLVMPAAARLTQSGRWLTLIAPPYIPYAPALVSHGVRLSRVMLVQTPAAEESVWACGQALRSHGCGAVLAWLERAPERSFRRLQLAVENNDAVALLFRPGRAASASPAALRLHVSKSQSRTLVRVLKRRGSDVPAPITLDLHGRLAGRSGPARVAMPLLPEEGWLQSSRGGGSRIEESV
ncbi:MAG TPA: translesion DNA synthesis-associated protein ImuA [Burkholderiales bacterium]|nr:translesion DNA synthesis-associated protein ImuA [Burkholderiales bacterium]